ncbi:MAG: exosortase C-terminal domain/associated protein EpsI [Thermodesulfobacteriota bacterium]
MANRARTAWLLAAVLLLALAVWLGQTGGQVQRRHLAAPLETLPLALGPWRGIGPDEKLDQATLALLRPQDYLLRNYIDPRGRPGALFVAYFGLQEEGAIIHSPRHCLPGGGWQINSRQTVAAPGGPWSINHLVISHGLDRLSVLYWYQGRGRVEADEFRDRLHLLLDGLRLGRTDGALVRLTSPLAPGQSGPPAEQLEMAAAIIPALARLMPANADGAGR